MKTTVIRIVGLAAVAGLSLAACSSSSKDHPEGAGSSTSATPSAASSGPSADVAAATQRISTLSPNGATNKILITQPLTAKPAKKTVYWLEGNLPVQQDITTGFKQATQALGWDLHVLNYDFADSGAPGAAMQQAVAANPKPDFIFVCGQSIAVLGQGFNAAKAAGIPVIQCGSVDRPKGKENDLYANTQGFFFEKRVTEVTTDKVIADSDGKAHVLFVNAPANPTLKIADETVTDSYKQNCAECKLKKLNVSFADLANGAVPSQVVSQIQSDPSINYVQIGFGDVAAGVPAALQAAGIKAKIIGAAGTKEGLNSVADGTSAAYSVQGDWEAGWVMIDAAARVAVGMPVDEQTHDLTTIEIWSTNDIPKPVETFQGPKDFQDQYKALWKLP